jgi:hypothetical protein
MGCMTFRSLCIISYSAFTDKVERNFHLLAPSRNCFYIGTYHEILIPPGGESYNSNRKTESGISVHLNQWTHCIIWKSASHQTMRFNYKWLQHVGFVDKCCA